MIPEGTSVRELAQLLEENGVCSASDFLEACNTTELDESYDVLSNINDRGERYYHLEGYLFPDTYDFYQNDDITSVLMKLVNNCNKKVMDEDLQEQISASNMTTDEVLTLASIIQREAANNDDMAMVVFRAAQSFGKRCIAGYLYAGLRFHHVLSLSHH